LDTKGKTFEVMRLMVEKGITVEQALAVMRDRIAVLVEEAKPAVDIGIDGHEFMLTDYGKQLADEILRIAPDPVLLIGGAGFGKSALARYVAFERGTEFRSVNFDAGMSLHPLIGQWNPKSTPEGITVEFADGALTAAVKEGDTFLAEELTRAPQELLSRLFGLLDTDFRSWDVIERGANGSTDIHEDFFLLATANPAGAGYSGARQLDHALSSRFAAIIEIDGAIAPEHKILLKYVDARTADAIMRFAEDCRPNKNHADSRSSTKYNVSTRNLVQIARHIKQGFSPQRAVEIAIAPKFPDPAGINLLAETHFKPLGAGAVAGDQGIPEPEPIEVTVPFNPTPAPAVNKGATSLKKKQRRDAFDNGCINRLEPLADIRPLLKASPAATKSSRITHWKGQGAAFLKAVKTRTADSNLPRFVGWACNCTACLANRENYRVELREATPSRKDSTGRFHSARDITVIIKDPKGAVWDKAMGEANVKKEILRLTKFVTGI